LTGGYEVFRVKRNPRSVSRETLIDEHCLPPKSRVRRDTREL